MNVGKKVEDSVSTVILDRWNIETDAVMKICKFQVQVKWGFSEHPYNGKLATENTLMKLTRSLVKPTVKLE